VKINDITITAIAEKSTDRRSSHNYAHSLLLSLLTFTLVTFFSLCSATSVCAEDAYFAGGEGTEKSPYEISNATQLAALATLVNAGNANYSAEHYILTADIDFSDFDSDGDPSNGNWTPIGITGYDYNNNDFYDHPFKGTFDGNSIRRSQPINNQRQC
jgi:hypothetical protein